MFGIIGLLSRFFKKNDNNNITENFLQVYKDLNNRDAKEDIRELQQQIIVKTDSRFESYIQKCKDIEFLQEIAYILTIFVPPLTSYQKIRIRVIFAKLLSRNDDPCQKQLIGHLIKKMRVDV